MTVQAEEALTEAEAGLTSAEALKKVAGSTVATKAAGVRVLEARRELASCEAALEHFKQAKVSETLLRADCGPLILINSNKLIFRMAALTC